ncbi:MAG: hypothetical protein JWP97_5721 [Labilithrix sp.]|nr:hypothetical protein [Labilithrix sp.]
MERPVWTKRLRRWATRLAVALLSAFVLHAIAMNVFLSTSLFETAFNRDPGTIFVSFERGWSIWPGTVHAEKLLIRSSDSNVQFLLRLDRCTFHFAPLDLALSKTFHVTSVTGTGISFRAKQRIESPAATPEYVDALPDIPGFETIPLRVLEPANLLQRWNDDYWHLFTVRLENVTANDLRDVWIDGMRWQGHADVTGGFLLKPIREVHVDDAHVVVKSGAITIVKRTVFEPIAGTIDLSVKTFDPRYTDAPSMFRHVVLKTDLTGKTPDLANLPRGMFRPATVGGAVDWRSLVFRLADGKAQPGTRVDATVMNAFFDSDEQRVAAHLTLLADVRDAGGAQLGFRVEARDVKATRADHEPAAPRAPVSLLTVPLLTITADARRLDIAEPLADLHVAGTFADAEVPDLHGYEVYLPVALRKQLFLTGGRARAKGDVEVWLADRNARARGSLEAAGIDVSLGAMRFTADAHAEGEIASWRWEMKAVEGARATVQLAHAGLAKKDGPRTRLLEVEGLAAHVESEDLDLEDPASMFAGSLDIPQVDLFDKGLLEPHLPQGKGFRISQGRARLAAHAAVAVRSHHAQGDFEVRGAQLGLETDALALSTDLLATGRFHGDAWKDGELDVDDARAVLSHVAVVEKASGARALSVSRASVTARGQRMRLDDPLAHVQLEARVEGGRLDDAVAINAFLPDDSDLRVVSAGPGSDFSAEARGEAREGVGSGKVTVRGHGIGVRGEKLGVLGDVDADLALENVRPDEGTMAVARSRFALTGVQVRIGKDRVNGAGPPELTAQKVGLEVATDRLDVKHPSLSGVDYHLVLEKAVMPDVKPLGELLSSDPFVFGVDSGKAQAEVDLTCHSRDQTASGHGIVVLENAGVHLHDTRLAGNFQVALQVRGFDKAIDAVDVAGSTITMRGVHTTGANAQAHAWDGEVTLVGGAVRVTGTPVFDGLVQLRADDATPILALALGNSLPKFVVGMLKASQLTGQARVSVAPGSAAILGARVRGGDVALAGHYVVAGDHVRGAVSVAKGPLSAGIRVDDAGTYVRLFGLESWMREETEAALLLFADPRKVTPGRQAATGEGGRGAR